MTAIMDDISYDSYSLRINNQSSHRLPNPSNYRSKSSMNSLFSHTSAMEQKPKTHMKSAKSFPSLINHLQKHLQPSIINNNKFQINDDCKISDEEYASVLKHTKKAWTKDFQSIINNHEPQVIEYRNKTYNQAITDGITAHSPTALRLPYIQRVIEYTFESVEPPNKYTADTDRKHFKEVAQIAVQFYKRSQLEHEYQSLQNMQKTLKEQQKRFCIKTSETLNNNLSLSSYKIPLTLIISSWCHDIERFLPCTKCEYLAESVDHYRKQIIHPITSARICCEVLLKNAPITEYEIERVKQIILHHDLPYPLKDIYVQGQCLVSGVSDQSLMDELQLLMDADSFAFFRSTLGLFIEYKRKKSSAQLVWKRVLCNVVRLRPHLRVKAVEAIKALPIELQNKMDVNYGELEQVLSEK